MRITDKWQLARDMYLFWSLGSSKQWSYMETRGWTEAPGARVKQTRLSYE